MINANLVVDILRELDGLEPGVELRVSYELKEYSDGRRLCGWVEKKHGQELAVAPILVFPQVLRMPVGPLADALKQVVLAAQTELLDFIDRESQRLQDAGRPGNLS